MSIVMILVGGENNLRQGNQHESITIRSYLLEEHNTLHVNSAKTKDFQSFEWISWKKIA